MAVSIIDPHDINHNTNITNGIPQYQDMYLFAELTAEVKGRSVIMQTDGGTFQSDTSTDKQIKINFLGVDQEKKDDIRMTTDWYDDSRGDKYQYEGFGISRIDVDINSSFIPQVNIEFVDIKGYSFFNQADSPYRILFNFPPPIFELTIKGYYGKAIKYKLHLVKYTTGFNSDNGNFIINAQFIALTYAPLSDVLFRYVINVPLIDKGVNLDPNGNTAPTNTYELLLKLQSLYSSSLNDILDALPEKKDFDKISTETESVKSYVYLLKQFKDNQYIQKLKGTQLYFNEDDTEIPLASRPVVTPMGGFDVYDDYIKSIGTDSISTYPQKRLYLLLKIGDVTNAPDDDYDSYFKIQPQNEDENYFNLSSAIPKIVKTPLAKAMEDFNNYRDYLIKALTFATSANINVDEDFQKSFKLEVVDEDNLTQLYCGLDLTTLYIKVYKHQTNLLNNKKSAAYLLREVVNQIVYENLGMNPTIYNIFELILNDVDSFFNKLHSVSLDASEHHNGEHKTTILSLDSYADVKNTEIYPFPLIIRKDRTFCGGVEKQERVSPEEINKKLGDGNEFPETNFVYDFINTMLEQNNVYAQLNMKEETNDDGTKKWSPLAPVDSVLGGSESVSPYISSTFAADSKSRQYEAFKTLLNRFYIISQYTLMENFYNDKSLRSLFAQSEAYNMTLGLTNGEVIQNIKLNSERFKKTPSLFYEYLEKELGISGYSTSSHSINLTRNKLIWNNKNRDDFFGVQILDIGTNIGEQDPTTTNNELLRGFYEKNVTKKWQQDIFQYTDENLIWLRDGGEIGYSNYSYETRYCPKFVSDGISGIYYAENPAGAIATATALGNKGGATVSYESPSQQYKPIFYEGAANNDRDKNLLLKKKGNVLDTWFSSLGITQTFAFEFVADDLLSQNDDTSLQTAAILITSNFGAALSPFDYSTAGALNKTVFQTPAIVEVPNSLVYYIGSLVGVTEGTTIYNKLISHILRYANSGTPWGTAFNYGVRIFADAHDINTYMSDTDKQAFRDAYEDFYDNNSATGDFYKLKTKLTQLVNKHKNIKNRNKRQRAYEGDINSAGYFDDIFKPLLEKRNILNNSDGTFSFNELGKPLFLPLSITNTTNSAQNNEYFRTFFTTLSEALDDRYGEIVEENRQRERYLRDEDILTQTYYSFKNIHDKWLCGVGRTPKGYPFNEKGGKLIDLFSFVDRGMNPIGGTIINPEILLDVFNDPTVSVFTVLSQLLSINGFEFFPLQNFMYGGKKDENNNNIPDDWEDSFKIDVSGVADESPAFICMYIGGTSSYPSGIGQYGMFEDDGVASLDLPPPDMGGEGCNNIVNTDDDRQLENNTKFPYSQVRAFRVRFGEQNQSMFQGIKIDSKEYPETNESIQILSRIAGDEGGGAPVPKGQNLYNLYENRSYKATVNGLGNAMIQPTQYFQIENVPLYNGAYIILTVNHSIQQNFMTTSFEGTKILRYPIPRVKEPLSILSSSIGDDIDTALNYSSGNPQEISQERLNQLSSVLGVDLSKFQTVDWDEVTTNNSPEIKFAIIKATQGYTKTYGEFVDSKFISHAQGAHAKGLKVGYYHFATCKSVYTGGTNQDIENDAIGQADYFAEKITLATDIADGSFIYPELGLFLDIENYYNDKTGERIEWLPKNRAKNTLWVEKFMERLEDRFGKNICIYARQNILDEQFTVTEIKKYPLWIARYLPKPEVNEPPLPKGYNNWTAWQFTEDGKVNGITTDRRKRVDLNIMREDYFNNPTTYLERGRLT